MSFVPEYSLIFHPDPRVFPAWPDGTSVGAPTYTITRPDYPFPLYLGTELSPGTILLARSRFEPESKAIAAYQALVFDRECHSL